jgi:NAD(P)H-dependent flavin oxidoreductase YrpB (nitropropane dioxygenase family)
MLHTRVCDILGIRHPVVQAGMASYVTPELVAAVSNAGGLGLLGSVDWSYDELRARVEAIRALTSAPFGVNVVLATPHDEKLTYLLEARVPVIATSWGDPAPLVADVRAAGARLLHQVETPAEAAHAARAGVDVIIAQGSDGGGHIGHVGTLALTPAVVDAAAGVPVIAAGGIADGRGLAAALLLGAEGAMLGTRFLATPEAGVSGGWKDALVVAEADAAWQSDIPDLVWGVSWPGATTRALSNDILRAWRGREDALRADPAPAQDAVHAAEAADNADGYFLFAGQSAGLVHDITPAGALVERIVAEAEATLARW